MKQMHAIQRTFGVTMVLAGLLVVAGRPAAAGMGRDRDPIDQLLKRDQLKEAVAGLEALKPKYDKESELHALLGECQWRLGQLPAARQSFEKAKQLNDKSAHAYAGLALVALSGDQVDEAAALARQALERDHNLWLANYAMGRVLMAQGSLDKAFTHFEKGEKLKGREDGRDLFEAGLGLLALAEKDAASAETHLIKARALAGNTVEHVMNLTDMYEATNQWGQASTLLAGMVEQVGPSPQLLFRLGRAYENQRRYNEAFEQYQKAVAADSTYAPGRAGLGHLLLMDTRRTAQAVPHLIAAEKVKETPQVLIDLGIALTRLGRQKEAVPRLQKYLEFENTPLARARLAAALVGTDDWAKGIDMFEKDVELRNEAQAEDLVAVGVRFISEQHYADARRYLNLALEKAPDDIEATYRLGIVDVHEKNYAAGIEKIRKKVTAAPSAAAWQNLAIAQQGLQQYDEAIESYRKVVELAPDAASAWVRLATVYSIRQRNDDALQAYSKALSLAPSNIEALRGRGYTNLLTGRYPQAIADLRPATQADPGHADSWLWLGQALIGAGEVDQARAALEKAIELAPDNETAHEALDAINRRG